MSSKITNKELYDLYQEYSTLYTEKKELEKQAKEKDKRLKQIETIFSSAIPAGDAKAGIYHKVTYGKSVSYAKVVTEARNLIPKTKHQQLDEILNRYTKQTPRHTFLLAEEQNDQ